MPGSTPTESSAVQPARILHMGGTPEERDLVRKLLEPHGHDVVEAPGGPEGVDLARRLPPDLILLDLMSLPADYETATRLRSFPETQHVPLVTMGPAEDRERALSLGCDGYIATPLKQGRFLRDVQAFLGGKRQRVRSTVQRHHLEAYSKRLVEKLEAKVGELTRTNERLRQVDVLKNQILENVSHELATPLTPLIGYLDLLESGRLGPVPPRQRRALTSIAYGIRRLGRTLDRPLDLASLQDTESAEPSFEVFDPERVAEEAIEALQGKARSRKVALDLRCPAPATVRADRGRLRQALIHLLDNAIVYSPRGGHVLLEVVSTNGRTRFSVYDQGEVIPAELEGQVFDLFSPPGRRSSAGGSGPTLGVAVARRIAEAHSGRASVESPPRNQPDTPHPYPGARFSIELPTE